MIQVDPSRTPSNRGRVSDCPRCRRHQSCPTVPVRSMFAIGLESERENRLGPARISVIEQPHSQMTSWFNARDQLVGATEHLPRSTRRRRTRRERRGENQWSGIPNRRARADDRRLVESIRTIRRSRERRTRSPRLVPPGARRCCVAIQPMRRTQQLRSPCVGAGRRSRRVLLRHRTTASACWAQRRELRR